MTSANTLPYRVFQGDTLIAAFEAHDEAVSWCKDVSDRTITTYHDFKPITLDITYTVKRFERVVFEITGEERAKNWLDAIRHPSSEGPE